MRGAFIRTLVELGEQDPRIMLLTGDLGYMALEPFLNRFPDRFINVGAAEQNMVGLATGLAESGLIPFVYSIVTFATLRPFEFIRNGPIHHKLPVRIVGVGGGVEYGHNGLTHYGLEDIGVMRTQPGISIYAPADHEQTCEVLRQTYKVDGPVYYRLGKDDRVTVPGLNGRFEKDNVQMLSDGADALIISVGAIASEAVAAVELLRKENVACSHVVLSTINPVPLQALLALLSRFKTVLTVEAHYQTGGLTSLICEIVAQHGLSCKVTSCAVEELAEGLTGGQQYLQDLYGISAKAIAQKAAMAVRERKSTAVAR